jgi:hypothetical protein
MCDYTVVGEWTWRTTAGHHGHRFATATAGLRLVSTRYEGLPALGEVLNGAINLCGA